jgi:hypothetical protein
LIPWKPFITVGQHEEQHNIQPPLLPAAIVLPHFCYHPRYHPVDEK